MKNTDKALWRGDLQTAVMGSQIKPTYTSEAANQELAAYLESAPTKVMKQSLLKDTKKTHSTKRINPT